ncbi:MAG: endonuclease/exonuclease/phosphatase family protein [Acidobacteriota bacterium]
MNNAHFKAKYLASGRRFCGFLRLLSILGPSPGLVAQKRSSSGPALLTFNDLVALYENDVPAAELQNRLTQLLSTPFIDNSLNSSGLRRVKPIDSAHSEKSIRIAAWNIERGLEFEAVKAALTSDQRFFRRLSPERTPAKRKLQAILDESSQLSQADVIVLNEVDWGLKRTNYRNVARELATAGRMNYAYAVEFVEVDPLTLGTETLEGDTSTDKPELLKNIAVDKSRTLGLHGTAILSRFPLRNVRIVRFTNQGHDWYTDEKKGGPSKIDKAKQKGASLVFSEKVLREVRRGDRMMLLADIVTQDLPGGILTIVATHLEAKSKPEHRRKQLEEILAYIKPIGNPVVVAGDMNTSGKDSAPTSMDREIKKRFGSSSFWVNKGIKYATGVGLLYDLTLGLAKAQRTKHDPTVKSVRFVSENPEERFFTTLKDFRFADGGAFDFRGSKEYSTGRSEETLSNSNERASKGFVSTLELKGKVTIELKLDWIFVKPAQLTDPHDTQQPYLMAPQFGRTLKALNYSLKDRISDHNPLIVDLRW